MFKKSYYNEIITHNNNGEIILFNSRTGALTIMNKEAQEIYYNIENIDEALVKEGKQKEYLVKMKENGFIVDINTDEFKLMEVVENISRYNDDLLTLTIAPTTACNMACPYCYEGNNIKLKPSMDEGVKNNLIKFVINKVKNAKTFKVCWYGGEPLLEKQTIAELSLEFIKICNELGIHYGASMVTNGVLLDYETAKYLKKECKVNNVQITLDGPKDINDQRRLLKNSASSFDIITKNIDDIKDIINVTIRINVDNNNLNYIEKLVDYITNVKKWGKKVKFYMYPVINKCNECSHDDKLLCDNNELSKTINRIMSKVCDHGSIEFMANSYIKPRNLSCSATKYNNFLVDPQGDLYKCWSQIGNKDMIVGNVKDGERLNPEHVKWMTLNTPKECEGCKRLPLCKGGCGLLRINNGNKPVCDVGLANYKNSLELKYKEYIR